MVISEPIVEALATDADLDDAQALVAEAGWNQNHADWRIFLELGRVFGARAPDGALLGTAATLPYPGGFGWISMVLVATAWRRRGIATRLLNRCIETLQAMNSTPMLDATPAGREVYRRLGFHDSWAMTRWRRVGASSAGQDSNGVRALEDRDWPALLAIDAACFGCSRAQLLERLRNRSREFACVAETNGRLRGFLLGRDGRMAIQFGPLVAEDERTAASLINFAGRRAGSSLFLDALDRHGEFAGWLVTQGFVKERTFTRMILGSDESSNDPRQTVVIAGPELG